MCGVPPPFPYFFIKTPAPPAPAPAKRPQALVQVETQIEDKELEVAELERRLAGDWGNLDTAAAYRRAREELEALLARWEALFEQTSV